MSATADEQRKLQVRQRYICVLILQLAVAKAALSASLSAPGEAKVPTQLVASFQTLLTSVASQPSQRNVKVCARLSEANARTVEYGFWSIARQ